ncbi:eEF1A lysine and N-terminal methyltransferase isoform X2 [Chanos chanos]|uniref:eEF1A lysine and N-terminal methyltransferase n=1 Tax=Chanos chanos TaxID=29144 RepID=A0A6J2V6P1_CHACN|nr:eEF1A lysine and N-terminal methyltransferase isoform X2 [Chanos chanos]
MNLLPRTAEEFSSADYWERFFRKRGDKAFEWYGDYNSLCGVLHKYIKPREKVLVLGCGNSELSEQLYDVGYRNQVNIDISETVISHMIQRNAERRPDLTFQRVDATQTGFESASFQAALDKGTLDAMASEEEGALARRMLEEVGRVLSGRESDWLYSSPEGRSQLASSANFRRLVIVAMHRDQEYADMQAVQSELSPMVMDLAPPAMPANQQVPFLSVGGDLGWREVRGRGVSGLTGEYSVEDVRGEDGHLYRRLVFMNNDQLVQSESRLRTSGTATSAHKKKNRKKTKASADHASRPAADSAQSVDRGFLCCAHHKVMVAGFAMLGNPCLTELPVSVLVVGLGGGSLPQFVRDFVPHVQVEVVELDPEVLEVAQTWFGFETDDRLKVTLGDGLQHISTLESEGDSYDVIIFDVDSKDPTLGMSCPPPAFVEMAVLERVRKLLTPRGVFMLNLVCRDSALRQAALADVRAVFPCVFSRSIEGEVNEVLLCSKGSAQEGEKLCGVPPTLQQAAKGLQGALSDNCKGKACGLHIDVVSELEKLRVS